MAGKYRLSTLGCKVNQYESQRIRDTLHALGFHPARGSEFADVAVVNSCAVTDGALRKSRQTVRRLARNGRTDVYVVGCGASADAERFQKMEGVTAALGHDVDIVAELRDLIGRRTPQSPARSPIAAVDDKGVTLQRPVAMVDDEWMMANDSANYARAVLQPTTSTPLDIKPGAPGHVKLGETLAERIEAFEGHERAFLKVQDGCDAFCTYCIIPRLRPVPRWKPVADAVDEARALVRTGHKEIVVTGIFLGAYGRGTALRKRFDRPRSPLAELVDALARVDGLERLRLSSLEPGDVEESLLEVLAGHKNCVPHLHLPLQSGSVEVLRRMNRQYSVDAFNEMIGRVRDSLDRPAITTDIIVGFPGETERDFEASVEVARHAQFAKIHAFPFSPRENTAAFRWKRDFVEAEIVRDRMKRLADVEGECSLGFRRRALGAVERVLVEGDKDDFDACLGERVFHGRTDRYFEMHFFADHTVRPGNIVRVRVDRVTTTRTHGTYVPMTSDRYPLSVLPDRLAMKPTPA